MPSASPCWCDHGPTGDSHVALGSWCGPCRVLSPVLEKVVGNAEIKTGSGRSIDLVTIDTDEHGALAQKYGVGHVVQLMMCR